MWLGSQSTCHPQFPYTPTALNAHYTPCWPLTPPDSPCSLIPPNPLLVSEPLHSLLALHPPLTPLPAPWCAYTPASGSAGTLDWGPNMLGSQSTCNPPMSSHPLLPPDAPTPLLAQCSLIPLIPAGPWAHTLPDNPNPPLIPLHPYWPLTPPWCPYTLAGPMLPHTPNPCWPLSPYTPC